MLISENIPGGELSLDSDHTGRFPRVVTSRPNQMNRACPVGLGWRKRV